MKIPSLFIVLLLLFGFNVSLAVPTDEQSPAESLSREIKLFLEDFSLKMAEQGYRLHYEAGKLDPRLKLKPCIEPWSVSFTRDPLKNARNSLELSCQSAERQKLFLNVSVEIFAPAIVSSRVIARGQRITQDDLSFAEQQINAARHPIFRSNEQVLGMVAKRTIRAGREIHPGMLAAPRLVSRGDEVLIIATNEHISIKMKGEALTHGALGEQISVRNLQSKRLIRARVAEQGVVEIAL